MSAVSSPTAARSGRTFWAAASDLYYAWKAWCIVNGEEPGTQTAFGRRLSELRNEAGKQRFPPDRVGQTRVRMGLRLRETEQEGKLA